MSRPCVGLASRLIMAFGSESARKDPHWVLHEIVRSTYTRVPHRVKLENGLDIIVPWCDQVGDAIARNGCFEPESVRELRRLLKPGMTFFDVGAHSGQYTLFASQLVGDSGQVHSFEPERTLAGWLQQSVELNHLKNVTVNRTAVSDEVGEVAFFQASDASVNSIEKPREDLYDAKPIRVPCTTLDHYLEKAGVDHVDIMKMDIEGAELKALQAAKRVFGADRKPQIIIEFAEGRQEEGGSSLQSLASFLVGHGYRLDRIDDEGLIPLTPDTLADHPTHRTFNVLATTS